MEVDELFDITGKVSVITGGAGILCSEMANSWKERVKNRNLRS